MPLARIIFLSVLPLTGFASFLAAQPASPFKLASPAEQVVAGENGRNFVLTAAGLLQAKSPDGRMLWERSLVEEFGAQIDPGTAWRPPVLEGGALIISATRQLPPPTGNMAGESTAFLTEHSLTFDAETGELMEAQALLQDGGKALMFKDRLRVIPAEFSLLSGQSKVFDVMSLDKAGKELDLIDEPKWSLEAAGFAREDSLAGAPPSTEIAFDAFGKLEIAPECRPRVFVLRAKDGKMAGQALGRVLPDLPIYNSFESMPTDEPPAYWIGGRWSWKVKMLPDQSGLALQPIPQAGVNTVFLGAVGQSEYTMQADLHLPAVDGESPGVIGLVNQRFMAVVELQTGILSVGRFLEYPIQASPLVKGAGVWTLQFRVEADPADATHALLSARIWPSKEAKPADEDWTIRARLPLNHAAIGGAPGLLQAVPAGCAAFVDDVRVYR